MKLMAGAGYEGQANAVLAAVGAFESWLQQLVAGAADPAQLRKFILSSPERLGSGVAGSGVGDMHRVRILVDRDLRCQLGFDDGCVGGRAHLANLLAKYPAAGSGFVFGVETIFALASKAYLEQAVGASTA